MEQIISTYKQRSLETIEYAQLANIIGMQQPAISRLENGGSNATISTLFKVIDALNLDVEFKPRNPIKS